MITFEPKANNANTIRTWDLSRSTQSGREFDYNWEKSIRIYLDKDCSEDFTQEVLGASHISLARVKALDKKISDKRKRDQLMHLFLAAPVSILCSIYSTDCTKPVQDGSFSIEGYLTDLCEWDDLREQLLGKGQTVLALLSSTQKIQDNFALYVKVAKAMNAEKILMDEAKISPTLQKHIGTAPVNEHFRLVIPTAAVGDNPKKKMLQSADLEMKRDAEVEELCP
ncbi:hypothetical protein HDU93_008827, partial [Gonapodya sp. JEL0774]